MMRPEGVPLVKNRAAIVGMTFLHRPAATCEGRTFVMSLATGLLVAVLLGACTGGSSTNAPTQSSSPPRPLSASEQRSLESSLPAQDPSQLALVVDPALLQIIGQKALLPPGTTVQIEPNTFRAAGAEYASVVALTSGTRAGRWTLYLRNRNGHWLVFAAEQAR
jgi:hypothetical protein